VTRRDYVRIAQAFADARADLLESLDPHDLLIGWEMSVDYMADMLERDNPNFDRDRFVEACEGDPS
jgi:hypothetical protein